MPTSGIRITDDVRNTYGRVFKKKANKLPYAVFKFNADLTEVVVDRDPKFYDREYDYNELLGKLPSDAPRFYCFEFHHLNKDGVKNATVLLFSWFPPACTTKQKFVAGTSFLSLAEALNVNKARYMEGEDQSDLNEDAILKNNKDWSKCPADQRGPLSQEPLDISEGAA